MEKIIAEIHHIIKDSNHVLDAETTLQAYFSDLVSQLMKEALEALDSELYVPFKAEGWRIANRDSRTITFTFGTVEFMRRRLKKKGEKSFFPLDNICGFNKSERYSTLLQKQVAELVTGSVYRGVAEAVTKLTSFSMSHGTVGNIVKSVGEKQAQWEKQNLEDYEVALPEEQKEVPFLLVGGECVVLGRRHHQAAQRRVVGHLVARQLDGRRRQRDGFNHRANSVHGVHAQSVGCSQINFTGGHRKRPNGVAISNEVAILGWSFDGIDRHSSERGIVCRRKAPFAAVVTATGTGKVRQHELVLVAVNQRLRNGAAQLAELDGAANVRHGVAQVHRETHLIHTHAGVVQRNANALALGHLVAHDGIRVDGLHEVEFHLVTLTASQVFAAHDGHVRSGLLADAFCCACLAAWHFSGQPVERAIALHGLKEKASGLYVLRIGRTRAYCCLGHFDLRLWDGGLPRHEVAQSR